MLQQIADAQLTTFVIKDLEHRFLLVDQALADSLGLSVEKMIGRHDLEVGIPERMVLGDSKLGFPGFWALDDEAVKAGCPLHEADSDLRKGSESMYSADTLRTPLRDKDGNITALLVQSRDVSDLIGLHQNLAENRATVELQDGHLSVLGDVLTSLMQNLDLDTLFDHIAETIVVHTRAQSAYIWMLNEAGCYMEAVAAVGPQKRACLGLQRPRGQGIAGKVWEDRKSVFMDKTTVGRYWLPDYIYEQQLCCVPLIVDDDVIGVMVLGSFSWDVSIRPEIALAEKIANIAAIAIKNAQLMASTQAELSRSRALSELGSSLSAISDPYADTDAVCRKLLDTIDINGAVFVVVNEHGTLESYVAWGKLSQEIKRLVLLPAEMVAETICAWCCQTGEEAFISRDQLDARESSRIHAMRDEMNYGSTSCMPVMSAGKVFGALSIVRERQRCDLNEREINVFRTVVNQLSAALERYDLHSALHHQANHDSLTKLPNRRQFEEELSSYLEPKSGNDAVGAVMFMDLDGFKLVNDTLGHGVGDELLKLVACRLSGCLRSEDLLARMGGDEFAVIIKGSQSLEYAVEISTRLSDSLSKPFLIDGSSLNVGTSMGICRFPEDGTNVDDLLRKADVAMYQAKNNGKGQILCFDQTLATKVLKRVQIEYQLRQAIAEEQFELFYQPKVNCQTGIVDGIEALIRWRHPDKGLIAPADFISVAEEAGLINAIGSWVLNEAVWQASQWSDTALGKLRIAVNIAASQFQLENFSSEVLDVLVHHGVPPDRLELEVTESIVMKNLDAVITRLQTLRTAGVRIAIDDFGTGYSSLKYLQDLPLDVLKIDRSFILRLQHEECRQSLVNTILLLASGLGLETVAEGVETLEQKEKLVTLGCSSIQGFYYSVPVLADALPGVVESINALVAPEPHQRAA
ncbi:putative signaling protein [Granulosicoccus antarcticus IMCC3135]|uniref:cyclic-guanylate-specific phosphodiesterase n=2 Tax=Granulosicoccus TaxID=437504 RepID=A0A2Z2NTS0_9GAMM|nr:putative signaling protein [Granulosicoccus antarcticus IMCC3135]